MNDSVNGTMVVCEETLGKAFKIGGLVLMIFFLTFGVLGNSLVCISVMKYSFLQKLSNYLVFSLAVSDILVSSSVLPFDVVYWVNFPRWTLGSYMCNLWNSLFFFTLTASIFNLLAISGDRFVAVVFPLKYQHWMTLETTKRVLVIVWCYSTITGVLLFIFLEPPRGEVYTFDLKPSFYSFLLFGNVLFPFSVMVILYSKIYFIAKKHARKIATASIPQNSSQPRLSSILSRELRIARTLGIVLCCFVVCWLPFLIINIKILLDEGVESCEIEILDTVLCWLAYMNCLFNPVLYAFISQEFRRAFHRTLFSWKSNFIQFIPRRETPSKEQTHMKKRGGATSGDNFINTG